MKITSQKFQPITVKVSRAAKLRLAELQLQLRKNFHGVADRETTPGKLIEKLILNEHAFEWLSSEYSESEQIIRREAGIL